MVITILEARLESGAPSKLEAAYSEAVKELEEGMDRTFLLQDTKQPDLWRILTVWKSREALETMRQSGATPRGILIFRAAGAEPTLSIMNVVLNAVA